MPRGHGRSCTDNASRDHNRCTASQARYSNKARSYAGGSYTGCKAAADTKADAHCNNRASGKHRIFHRSPS